MALIDQPIKTILQAHSTQIAFAGTLAQLVLDYNDITLPWWGLVGLLGLVLVGRVVKQPAISGEASEQTEDEPWGV